MILIRGLGSNADHWYCHIPAFSTRYRTIVFDNHGIDRSDKLDVPYTIPMMADDTQKYLIDVSASQSKDVPSSTWRECIKKIWKQNPLICPECQSEMSIISFIVSLGTIRKILEYLKLRGEGQARDPPYPTEIPDEIVYVPTEDTGWTHYENPAFTS